MKKFNVGDSVKFKDGRTGKVVDYTDTHYIVKDSNGNQVKIKMVKDSKQFNVGLQIEVFASLQLEGEDKQEIKEKIYKMNRKDLISLIVEHGKINIRDILDVLVDEA